MTRKLLAAVSTVSFKNRGHQPYFAQLLLSPSRPGTLATHSLTGKASPAFLSKLAKLCLDPEKVADIVMTVTANSHVK
ncbi:hypothetical protein EVAR_51402_1, partial [Eumeta japonica]